MSRQSSIYYVRYMFLGVKKIKYIENFISLYYKELQTPVKFYVKNSLVKPPLFRVYSRGVYILYIFIPNMLQGCNIYYTGMYVLCLDGQSQRWHYI